MSTTCTHHCRSCESHFTSLEAFDAHREGPAGSDRACTFPELPKGAEWAERTGACKIACPHVIGVAIRAPGTSGQIRSGRASGGRGQRQTGCVAGVAEPH
jgi:hypothetical protein